jgi:hypothetical protein
MISTFSGEPLMIPTAIRLFVSFVSQAYLNNFVGQADDFHVVLVTQFTGNRTKDTRAARVFVFVNDDCSVAVEFDVAAVFSASSLFAPNDDRTDNRFLLDVAARDNAFDTANDYVTESGGSTTRTPENFDAHDFSCTCVISDRKSVFCLNHDSSMYKGDLYLSF